MKTLIFALLLISVAFGQTPSPEQADLNRAVTENQTSPVDFIRVLEAFLAKYPATANRALIERQLAQSALQINDADRILLYGETLLASPPEDLPLLDRVMRIRADRTDEDSIRKSTEYVKRYLTGIEGLRSRPQPHVTPGQWNEQMDRAVARALALEAHALETAGKLEPALASARKSWATYPTGEGAREAGTILVKLNRQTEAIDRYADAFTLEDPGSTEADRARDRQRMGELYAKLHSSEKGLGDVILTAYDRTSGIMKQRLSSLRTSDPNAQASDIFDFNLPSGDGAPALALRSLKGKTVVMDFWATWCIPCRAQHPLLERVRKHYESNPEVVFLAVDTDDDPSVVKPFLTQQGWTDAIWLEGGLMRLLSIGSIPTILVLDPAGQVSSRVAGIIPERFEDMLIERIDEARRVRP